VHEIRAGAVAIVGQRRFLPDACGVLVKRKKLKASLVQPFSGISD
jgi:hypothetical protein